ncbi:hypothetical protein V8D89_016141 [Ganoderma adspersum]
MSTATVIILVLLPCSNNNPVSLHPIFICIDIGLRLASSSRFPTSRNTYDQCILLSSTSCATSQGLESSYCRDRHR